MVKVLKMPGTGCQYFLDNHCLYQERLNPGFVLEWKCQVLMSLNERFERLVERENPHLTLEQAGRIWHGWCESELSGPWTCPEYEYHVGEDGEEACARLFEDICLLRIPKCQGRCQHFVCEAPAFCDD